MAKDIKEILMDEIDSLINGKTDVQRANAVAKLSAQAIYKDRLVMEKEVLEANKKRWFGGKNEK